MNNEKLTQLVITLFESKLKNYTEKTVSVWVGLLSKYDYTYVIKAVEKIIYDKNDFISIGDISELIKEYEKEDKILHPDLSYDQKIIRKMESGFSWHEAEKLLIESGEIEGKK